MSTLDANQQEIAEILFNLPDATGFALAGGAALLAHGTIKRPTRDLDAFVQARPETPHGDVTPLLRSFETALTAADWEPTIIREHNTFARLLATKASATVEIDLAVDSPRLFPTETINGLPMLAQQDLAARKILAILDRAEGRDYTDLQALQHLFSRKECVQWAQQLDNGLTTNAIADAFGHLERLTNAELPTNNPDQTRKLFKTWTVELNQPGA